MNIKSDPEVVQRWHTHHWIGNFKAEFSMTMPRLYETDFEGKSVKTKNKNRGIHFLSKSGSEWVGIGSGQVQGVGVEPEPYEAKLDRNAGQNGPKGNRVWPKNGQTITAPLRLVQSETEKM